jgi:hypothetical protein
LSSAVYCGDNPENFHSDEIALSDVGLMFGGQVTAGSIDFVEKR